MIKTLRIVSRESKLALWQANYVKQQLNLRYPNIDISIVGVSTAGDKLLDGMLDKFNGKGLFTKELELSLLHETADIAVHSLKDMSVVVSQEFYMTPVLKRADAADAFISNDYATLDLVPDGMVIGTSSARRAAILNHHYPHLQVVPLRGNIGTRLDKLDSGKYAGIILAAAGLKRLRLETRIRQYLDKNIFVPAIGQGTLAIQTLKKRADLIELVAPLIDNDTAVAVNLERYIGNCLNADCSTPLAIYANVNNDKIDLHAMFLAVDSGQYREVHCTESIADWVALATDCVARLRVQ